MWVLVATPSSSASSTAREHGLLVVLQDEGEDLDHLAVTAGRLEQMVLQLPEGQRAARRRVRRCAGHRACAG